MHAAHRALGLTKGTPERGSPRVRGDQFRVPGDSKMGLAQRGWGSRKDGPTTPPPPHCAHSLSCTRCPWRTHRPLGPVPPPEPQAGCALCLGGYTVQWGEGIQIKEGTRLEKAEPWRELGRRGARRTCSPQVKPALNHKTPSPQALVSFVRSPPRRLQ